MKYSIEAVSKLTGLSAFTLRNWEKRFTFLRPSRELNGFRNYSEEDLALLTAIGALLKDGKKISELAELLSSGQPLPAVKFALPEPEIQYQVEIIYSALIRYDLEKAEAIISALSGIFSAAKVLENVYGPLFVKFGEAWEQRKISIAQEHFACTFIRCRLYPYLNFYVPTVSQKRSVLCATLSGEQHEGGLLLLAAQLKLKGWRVFYLGTEVPIDDLKSSVLEIRPSLVCLSFSQMDLVQDQLKKLCEIDAPIVVGGFGVRSFQVDKTLPKNIHVLKQGAREALETLEIIASMHPSQVG